MADLGALAGGGLTLPDALRVIAGEGTAEARRAVMLSVREQLLGGASLSSALDELDIGCAPFEIAALASGERSGELAPLLEELAVLLEQQCSVRERVLSAMLYPSLVFLLGIVVAVLMLGILVPRTAEMVEGTQVELPALTRAMVATGRSAPLAVGVALLAGCGVWLRFRRMDSEQRSARIDRALLRIPVLGAARLQLCAMRLCNTLAMLLRGGVPLVDALTLAGTASGSASTAAQLKQRTVEVRDGGRVSDALGALSPMGPLLVEWARIGESGGNLEDVLRTASARFSIHWERRVSRMLALLEPTLILIIGAFVLLVALSVLLPVLSLSRSVG